MFPFLRLILIRFTLNPVVNNHVLMGKSEVQATVVRYFTERLEYSAFIGKNKPLGPIEGYPFSFINVKNIQIYIISF